MEDSSLLSDSISNFSACSELSNDTESSWTPYIVDFVIHNTNNNGGNVGSLSEYDDSMTSEETIKHELKKKKKRKSNRVDDEALEDTASSPGNSPKVFCIERQDGSYRTKRDHPLNFNNILEQENIFVQRKERSELDINININININIDDMMRRRETSESTGTALKKKGLRLVPVSMVVKCRHEIES